MSDRKGINLIIDRVEALRVRLADTRERHATPPTNVGDERLIDSLDHWDQLCRDALKTAVEMRSPFEQITAQLALPADAPMHDVASAISIALRRLQKLEIERVAFSEAHTTGARVTFAPGYDGGPQCEAKGLCKDFDGSGTCYGCGRWLGGEKEPDAARAPVKVDPNEEPRPSWVLERLEALVLGGWLGDAVKNIERASEYMRANEERMSEDVFDELARVATKLDRWAEEIIRGNMFPESR